MNKGILSGVVAIAYIVIVAIFISSAQRIFGPTSDPMLNITVFLTVFVFSAAFMAITLFGRPVMMYIDGQKKEAVALVGWSLGSFLVLGAIIAVIVAVIR